jgi:hypothetical protein
MHPQKYIDKILNRPEANAVNRTSYTSAKAAATASTALFSTFRKIIVR